MRHYEIILLIHPDQSEQVPGSGHSSHHSSRATYIHGPPPSDA